MEPHCALKKEYNLLAYLHNKIHQSNLNSFLKGSLRKVTPFLYPQIE